MKECILGYAVRRDGLEGCVREISDVFRNGERLWLACLNPHSYVISLGDLDFRKALKDADVLVPDGTGVVWASRLLKGGIRERVTGSDVFSAVMKEANREGNWRFFFLGSTEDTLAEIRRRVARDFPNVQVAGTFSPPFKASYSQEENDQMVSEIKKAAPDVLWVGMTAPKQEVWIHQNFHRLETVKFAAAIGAVFDFYAGTVKRSHPVFQRIGLEWLPRLVQQPRRLWRRMAISAPIFLWHVLRARVSGKYAGGEVEGNGN